MFRLPSVPGWPSSEARRSWLDVGFSIVLLLFSAMALTGCKTLSHGEGALKPRAWVAEPHELDEDETLYRNIGATYQPTATKFDWARHSLKLFFGGYPGKDGLPDHHVMDEETANQQFRQALLQPDSLTWFGHGTFLINIGGKRILTDPTIARRIGLSPAAIGRLVPTLPNWRDPILGLDRLDAVLITHADYDHLDLTSLKMLRQKFPRMQIIVPEGTARMMRAIKHTPINEVAWYDRRQLGAVGIDFVPAIHGVRRPPFDLDTALWGGYVLSHNGRKLYLSGDIALGSVYESIARRYGPVDVAIVPVGGYQPQHFNRAFHTTPGGVIGIARKMGARKIIASHWGTYALSEETGRTQKAAFQAAMASQKGRSEGVIFKIGESRPLWSPGQ
ncbi:hypothetical protein FDK21_12430 [Cohaesibacter sp. CAU 1516]|nr:hypothetical protein FDK21_12430 [Cohaesibacter sp. CAU 1516]